jgi:F-type H+-transporting ATPase subunit gamma
METMRDIQNRLKSINSTKQITESMRLISTRKAQKCRQRRDDNRRYLEQYVKIIGDVAASGEAISRDYALCAGGHEIKDPETAGKAVVICVSCDRGLCGGYIANIKKAAQKLSVESAKKFYSDFYGIERFEDVPQGNRKQINEVVSVGGKCENAFQRWYESKERKILRTYRGLTENPAYESAREIIDGNNILERYKKGEINYVYLVFTGYKTMMSQTAVATQLLPLNKKNIDGVDLHTDWLKEHLGMLEEKINAGINANAETEIKTEIKAGKTVLYDTCADEFAERAAADYIYAAVLGAMLESAVSEQCARLMGMDSASKNSDKIIESLKLKYNQVRQSAITQEIAEIVGGANAVEQ